MTSTDDSPQIQVVPANGSSSDSNKTISDSSRTTTYEDLVQDSDLFWDKLRDFFGYTDKPLRVPIVGGNSLNLHQLFKEVTARGGIEKVIKERKCKEVIETFAFKTTITNASFVLKKYYVTMLFKFEHVYYLEEPVSSFSAREEELKRLVDKSANHDNELQTGTAVNGIIEGKFNNGYFVSIKMGSEELKGVLYRFPQTSLESRRRKKKSKSSQVDPNKPKSHRSGYNFFYSEHYQMLKPQFVGKGQLLTKEIGKMWSNLSASDRKVYQEKGAKDVERYNKEILEYRSLMDSRAAETVAVTDAAMNDAAAATEAAATDAAMNDAAETDAATDDEETQ